jgi:hypothetical protein
VGLGIVVTGLTHSLAVAIACLALAGAADSVSAVCRSTILQLVTPDAMRGRMASIFTVVVAGGPRLGDAESGLVAAAVGAQASVVSGGILCIAGVGAVAAFFPALWRYSAAAGGPERSA